MVDTLLKSNKEDNSAEISFEIKSDNIFLSSEGFSVSGIIEHMAQSCALKSGYEASLQEAEMGPITGYIGAVKNLEVERLPIIGEIIQSAIKVITQIQQISVVEIITSCSDELIAKAQLHIYQVENQE